MKHVIVIGKTGQLARALQSRADNHNVKVSAYGRSGCDLASDTKALETFAQNLPGCDGLIIAAAYTAVDKAEDETQIAQQVNGTAPGVFASECAKRNIPLVHISTDYVFPGNGKRPLSPEDATDPINAYGASKLAGETSVRSSNARAAILRTSWVFDGDGANFMTTMLRLAKGRSELGIVADQIGRPTYAGHLADASFAALKKLMGEPSFNGGTYHVSGTGNPVSWAEFADAIFAIAVDHIPHTMKVNYIPATDYPTPAKRPAYSVLDVSSFEQSFGHTLPDWHEGLEAAYKVWQTQA